MGLFSKTSKRVVLVLGTKLVGAIGLSSEKGSAKVDSFAYTPLPNSLFKDGIPVPESLRDYILISLKNIDLKKNEIVDVALTDSTAFAQTFPIEESLSHQALRTHVLWEMDHFISKSDDYVINSAVISKIPNFAAKTMLLIAIHKQIISTLQSIARQLKLSLGSVDLAHFGAEYLLHQLDRNDPNAGPRILVGVEEQRVSVSACHQFRTQSFVRRDFSDPSAQDTIVQLMNEGITESGVEDTSPIFLHGQYASETILGLLRRQKPNRSIELLIPTSNLVRMPDELLENPGIGAQLAGAIGLGIRSFEESA